MSVSETKGCSAGMDRRSFLKLSGLTAGVAALSCAALSGCASAGEQPSAEGQAVTSAEVPYSVYDTDILLIGGGYGAIYAMNAACRAGQNILCVDKGPWGFSGAHGMNFDIMNTWTPGGVRYASAEEVPDSSDLCNQALYKNTHVDNEVEVEPDVHFANFGEVLTARNEDGSPFYIYDFPFMRGIEHSMTRNWSDHFAAKDYITIHDSTMITDLIVEEGRCLGAVGIHIPTGDYRVYRAKATVSATGGSTQFFGWNSTSCSSNNVPDNTADVEMSILRHGGRISDNEFGQYDLMTFYPRSFAATNGMAMGADSVHSGDLVDKNGKRLVDYEEIGPTNMMSSQDGVIQAMSLVNEMGNGSENGGVYLRCTEESLPTMRWMYVRGANLLKEKFGFDFTKESVEVLPEMYEHGGQPIVDENAMCKDFEGLFVVRANSGSGGGNMNMTSRPMGRYAMMKAIEYAGSYAAPENVTWSSVADEIARLEDLRTREIEGSIRPISIRRKVQYACAEAARPVRPTAVLQEAQAELERIYAEDLPKMACADRSRVQNADWKDAIETLNLLDEARLFMAASLAREESRAAMIRPEFPETDDANWAVQLAFTKAADGTLSYEKLPY